MIDKLLHQTFAGQYLLRIDFSWQSESNIMWGHFKFVNTDEIMFLGKEVDSMCILLSNIYVQYYSLKYKIKIIWDHVKLHIILQFHNNYR